MDASAWSTGEKTFTIVNAPISDTEEHAQSLSACALLVEDQIAPLLFRSLEPPPASPNPPNFYVASAGNKGAGMFAARDIPAGALILVDRPVAVVPSNIDAPEWKRAAFDALIPRISTESQDALLALANVHPVAERPVVEGIALTNAFGVELLPSLDTTQEYGALFPSISRANHCCGLNTALKWDPATFSVCMYSLRAVRAGEEIHNQYIDVLAPRAERRAQLARYDFTCMCPHCDLPSEEAVARSDAARKALRDWRHLHPRFGPWSEDLCRADDTIIVSSLRALDLIEQEGLYGMSVPFLEDIALSYALLGDEAQFSVWAEKVVVLCAGQDPKRADKFGQLLEDPRRYKRWGARKAEAYIGDTEAPVRRSRHGCSLVDG